MASLMITKHEAEQAIAQKIVRYFDDRLLELREQNDESIGEDRTEKLRGRIAEIKEFQNHFKTHPEFRPVSHQS